MAKFELVRINEKLYPAALTNHSLSLGEKIGIIKGSHLEDVMESEFHLGVLYIAVMGVHKHLNLSLDDFMVSYNPIDDEGIQNYNNILNNCTDMKSNNFAKGFEKVTNKVKTSKDEKRRKPPKLNFECVEDRYVYYCLVYGIESDIFWYHPIPDVERIFMSKQAYDSWNSNPVTY